MGLYCSQYGNYWQIYRHENNILKIKKNKNLGRGCMQFICSSCKVSPFQGLIFQSVGNGARFLQLGKLRSFGTVWESLNENELDKLKKGPCDRLRDTGTPSSRKSKIEKLSSYGTLIF